MTLEESKCIPGGSFLSVLDTIGIFIMEQVDADLCQDKKCYIYNIHTTIVFTSKLLKIYKNDFHSNKMVFLCLKGKSIIIGISRPL